MVTKNVAGTLVFNGQSAATLEKEAAAVATFLRQGALVAFPTETVYGLGAHALDPTAVQKIFAAKGRPSDNPLIVHIHDLDQLHRLAKNIPKEAWLLAHHFWPGPLTLVLQKQHHVPDVTTGGLDSVAIRIPNHPAALALLRLAALPVAAPSANLSGRPSPTTAAHVLADLAGRIDAVLDGGPCDVGVESTVLDIRGGQPRILRPGGVTPQDISRVLQRECLMLTWQAASGETPPSPGLKYTHYAPRAPLYLYIGDPAKTVEHMQSQLAVYHKEHKKTGILVCEEDAAQFMGAAVMVLGMRADPAGMARRLYGALRDFDDHQVDVILAQGFYAEDMGLALMNRLQKAAGPRVIILE